MSTSMRISRRSALAMVAGAATALALPTSASRAFAAPATQLTGGTVVVYTSRAEALFKPIVDAFNKEYPFVTVTVLSGGNPQLAARILEERGDPKGDVFINSDSMQMVDLETKGLFQPNPSALVSSVPLDLRAENGSWTSLTFRGRVIMYNTELLSAEEAPKSVFDVIDPKWSGQIGSADSTNGAMMAQIAVIRRVLGEERAAQFVRGLVANDTRFYSSGHTDVRKAVGAGEYKLGLVNHYYYFLQKAEGSPVGLVIPDQEEGGLGMVVNSTNVAILQGAKNFESARLFVDFMLSTTAQKVYAEANYEVPIIPGVARAADVPDLWSYKVTPVSLKSMYEDLAPTRALTQSLGMQ